MPRLRITASALVAVLAALAVIVPLASAKGGGTVRQIALNHGPTFPIATGKAVYKVDGTERELQIEAEHIKQLAGKRVNVFVNGVKIGSPLVDSLGNARLNRNTSLGQPVPRIVTGSTVRVRTLGGTLILAGRF